MLRYPQQTEAGSASLSRERRLADHDNGGRAVIRFAISSLPPSANGDDVMQSRTRGNSRHAAWPARVSFFQPATTCSVVRSPQPQQRCASGTAGLRLCPDCRRLLGEPVEQRARLVGAQLGDPSSVRPKRSLAQSRVASRSRSVPPRFCPSVSGEPLVSGVRGRWRSSARVSSPDDLAGARPRAGRLQRGSCARRPPAGPKSPGRPDDGG